MRECVDLEKYRITVFTPTYNRKHLLPNLFESLKKQTNKDFVWLVIDYGSSDGTSELFEEWKKQDILNKTIENRNGKSDWVFYDGPIYANAKPGIHHVLAKTIKDSFYLS